MSFGTILKKLRQDINLTQDELAKKINTSRSNIANYENDKNMPSIDVLEKLSKSLNCSTDYLLGKTSIRNSEEKESSWLSEFMNNYVPPSEKQKEQIEELIKIIMKDNKKDNKQ